jgi:hypothetical protein
MQTSTPAAGRARRATRATSVVGPTPSRRQRCLTMGASSSNAASSADAAAVDATRVRVTRFSDAARGGDDVAVLFEFGVDPTTTLIEDTLDMVRDADAAAVEAKKKEEDAQEAKVKAKAEETRVRGIVEAEAAQGTTTTTTTTTTRVSIQASASAPVSDAAPALSKMKKADLVAECVARGVESSGTVADLRKRLAALRG